MSNRRRDKPLLTYGRRPSATPEAPVNKKRKTTHEPSPLSTPNEPSGEKDNLAPCGTEGASEEKIIAEEPKPSDERKGEKNAPKVKKGTIMSFFKPLPPKPKEKETVEEAEPTEGLSSSPTSQPTAKRRRKAPRLLRLRPNLPASDSTEDKENQHPTNSNDVESAEEVPRKSDTSGATDSSDATNPKKPKTAPSIQTTLNISSRAAFSECRLCDTVWNPSHADDVKYHKRRHAAVVRRRQRDISAEL